MGRAEDLAPDERDYDTVVMRCAGNPHELIPVAAALTRPGGLVIASGPPRQPATATDIGLDWIEVEGPQAPRLFALYRKPAS